MRGFNGKPTKFSRFTADMPVEGLQTEYPLKFDKDSKAMIQVKDARLQAKTPGDGQSRLNQDLMFGESASLATKAGTTDSLGSEQEAQPKKKKLSYVERAEQLLQETFKRSLKWLDITEQISKKAQFQNSADYSISHFRTLKRAVKTIERLWIEK